MSGCISNTKECKSLYDKYKDLCISEECVDQSTKLGEMSVDELKTYSEKLLERKEKYSGCIETRLEHTRKCVSRKCRDTGHEGAITFSKNRIKRCNIYINNLYTHVNELMRSVVNLQQHEVQDKRKELNKIMENINRYKEDEIKRELIMKKNSLIDSIESLLISMDFTDKKELEFIQNSFDNEEGEKTNTELVKILTNPLLYDRDEKDVSHYERVFPNILDKISDELSLEDLEYFLKMVGDNIDRINSTNPYHPSYVRPYSGYMYYGY